MRYFELIERDDAWHREREYQDALSGQFKDREDNAPEFEHWPPSDIEMKRVERQVLQDPQWLARWAYFGWKSWMTLSSHVIDQKYFRDNKFRFYDIPAIWYHPNSGVRPDRIALEFDIHGKLLTPVSHYDGEVVSVPLPSAVRLIQDYIHSVITPETLKWMAGRYYVRFGKWREDEKSQNFLASTPDNPVWEKGVSAYHAEWSMDDKRWDIADGINEDTINGTLSTLVDSKRPIYLIQGTELSDDGADGEPLLKDVKMVKQVTIMDINVPGVFDPREDL